MLLTNPTGYHPDCPFLSPPKHTLGTRRTSPPRPWAPLSDDEWAVLSPFVLRSAGPGRPLRDPRKALDAVFWLAARPQRALPPWRVLPAEFGKPDTAARRFRRWAEAGLWSRLLRALADPEYPGIAVLRRLESWICRTYRRAWRILGVPGVSLARRLGFLSALRAPTMFLPDPDLSEHVQKRLRPVLERLRGPGLRRSDLPFPDFLSVCAKLLKTAGGRPRVPRHLAWP